MSLDTDSTSDSSESYKLLVRSIVLAQALVGLEASTSAAELVRLRPEAAGVLGAASAVLTGRALSAFVELVLFREGGRSWVAGE